MSVRRSLPGLVASALFALLLASPASGAPEAEPIPEQAVAEAPPRAATAPAGEGAATSSFGDLSFTSVDEPIVVEADKLEFDYENNRLVYRGTVHVVQGEFELSSKTLIVVFDRADELESAQLREVVAEGDVVITQGERRASGEVAVFDQTTRKILLLGNPVLRDGPNEVKGDRLTVYLDEGRSVVESSPKKRVSAVLYPGQTEEAQASEGSPSPRQTATAPPAAASPAPTGEAAP